MSSYHVDCPYCGAERSLSDSALWPNESERDPPYPEPSTAQRCLDCPGWMRVVMKGRQVAVERALPRYDIGVTIDDSLEVDEHPSGEWVRWDDVELFLRADVPPRGMLAALHERARAWRKRFGL